MSKIEGNNSVKGYKVFNPDWTCSAYGITKQYTCPGKFEENIKPKVYESGMHFCKNLIDCFNYYKFDSENHVAEVIAYGDIKKDSFQCCTNKLEIVRELTWEEVLQLTNTGEDCIGCGNTGNWNTGIKNSGHCNSGSHNTGGHNDGNWNSGSYNTGSYNSGSYNTSDCNSGDYNSGYGNTGSRNSGDWNTGSHNSGNHNTGSWNKCNESSGFFNTITQPIFLFDKPCSWEELEESEISEALDIMNDCPMEEEDRQDWWCNLPGEVSGTVTHLPNFDPKIFKEITGIDVD